MRSTRRTPRASDSAARRRTPAGDEADRHDTDDRQHQQDPGVAECRATTARRTACVAESAAAAAEPDSCDRRPAAAAARRWRIGTSSRISRGLEEERMRSPRASAKPAGRGEPPRAASADGIIRTAAMIGPAFRSRSRSARARRGAGLLERVEEHPPAQPGERAQDSAASQIQSSACVRASPPTRSMNSSSSVLPLPRPRAARRSALRDELARARSRRCASTAARRSRECAR